LSKFTPKHCQRDQCVGSKCSEPCEEFLTVLKSIERSAEKHAALAAHDLEYPFLSRFDRSRYSEHYLISRVPEDAVENAIIETLHLYSVDATKIDAGQKRARGRVMAAAKAMGVDPRRLIDYKSGGLPTGHSDLIATLAPNGLGLFIEVKAPAWIDPTTKSVIREAGKPTQEQLDFLLSKHQRGAIVLCAWSVDDVTRRLFRELEANRKALADRP
jgi:hypothetical protein